MPYKINGTRIQSPKKGWKMGIPSGGFFCAIECLAATIHLTPLSTRPEEWLWRPDDLVCCMPLSVVSHDDGFCLFVP